MSDNLAPKFNFDNLDLSESEFQKQEDALNVPKFLEPGVYTLKITKAAYKGVNLKDSTWMNASVEFSTTNGQSIRHSIMVPTSKISFSNNGKESLFPMITFRKFLSAIGVDHSLDNIGKTLKKYFSDLSALEGKSVEATVGYKGAHFKFNKDTKDYLLVDREGRDILDSNGQRQVFADRNAGTAAAAEQGLRVEGFVNILSMTAIETTNDWN